MQAFPINLESHFTVLNYGNQCHYFNSQLFFSGFAQGDTTISRGDDKCQNCGYALANEDGLGEKQHDCEENLFNQHGYVICNGCKFVSRTWPGTQRHREKCPKLNPPPSMNNSTTPTLWRPF